MKRSPLLLPILVFIVACGPMPGDTTDGSTGSAEASTTGLEDTTGALPRDTTGSSGGEAASSSGGDVGTTSGGGMEGGGSSGVTTSEPASTPACFGDACEDECGPGLYCLPHPLTGERMCVTLCPAYFCEVEPVSCGALAPKVPPTACVQGACFPALCESIADCPSGSIECDGGLCY